MVARVGVTCTVAEPTVHPPPLLSLFLTEATPAVTTSVPRMQEVQELLTDDHFSSLLLMKA